MVDRTKKADGPVKIQDEQGEAVWTQPEYSLWPEQEEEIKKIREQNAKNEREAQNGMDMGLMVVALMYVSPPLPRHPIKLVRWTYC